MVQQAYKPVGPLTVLTDLIVVITSHLYVFQIIKLYTLRIYNFTCKLYPNKIGKLFMFAFVTKQFVLRDSFYKQDNIITEKSLRVFCKSFFHVLY